MTSDHDLTLAAQSGDHRAADQLVRRHMGFAYGIADHGYFLQGADCDDTRQEALIALYLAIVGYQPDRGATFLSFARLVIHRRVASAARIASGRGSRILTDTVRSALDDDGLTVPILDLIPASGSDSADLMEQHADLHALVLATRQLTPLERRCLLGIASGHTYHEISAAAGDTTKSIDNAAARARRKLRALLEAA